jgi:hypothetical protein
MKNINKSSVMAHYHPANFRPYYIISEKKIDGEKSFTVSEISLG